MKELQDSGWNFTYIGANQDLSLVQAQLGFFEGNILSFESNPLGTAGMSHTVSNAIANYTTTRSQHIATGGTTRCSTQNLYNADSNSGDKAVDSVDMTITTGDQVVTNVVTVTEDEVAANLKENQDSA